MTPIDLVRFLFDLKRKATQKQRKKREGKVKEGKLGLEDLSVKALESCNTGENEAGTVCYIRQC